MTLTQARTLTLQGGGPQCFGRVVEVEGDDYTIQAVVIGPERGQKRGRLGSRGGPQTTESVSQGHNARLPR